MLCPGAGAVPVGQGARRSTLPVAAQVQAEAATLPPCHHNTPGLKETKAQRQHKIFFQGSCRQPVPGWSSLQAAISPSHL